MLIMRFKDYDHFRDWRGRLHRLRCDPAFAARHPGLRRQHRQADLCGESRFRSQAQPAIRAIAFEQADICDGAALRALFDKYQPDAVMNLAAESHVDRSIDGPGEFIQTNIVGTFTLLQEALRYWRSARPSAARTPFASCTSRPTRCSARSAIEGFFTETTRLRAELALLGQQGFVGPSGPRLARDLRACRRW